MLQGRLNVMGYQPLYRIDKSDHAWTFAALQPATDKPAALKFYNPNYFSLAAARDVFMQPLHPQIPRIIRSGFREETRYVLREWAPGETLYELLERPPSPYTTWLLIAGIYSLTEVVEWLHAEGDTFEGAARVHGRINAHNVVVSPGGRASLINAEHSYLATGVEIPESLRHHLAPISVPVVDPRPEEVRDVLNLFESLWTCFRRGVIPFNAIIPRPIAALRGRAFHTIAEFRAELKLAAEAWIHANKPW